MNVLSRLRLIQLQIEVLHVLDQRRSLVADVLERQQRIDCRIVQIPLDVPDDLQAGLGVEPTPVLCFDVAVALDISALKLPSVVGGGKRMAVVGETERRPRPDPAVEPRLRGRFAGVAGHDRFEPSFDQRNLAFASECRSRQAAQATTRRAAPLHKTRQRGKKRTPSQADRQTYRGVSMSHRFSLKSLAFMMASTSWRYVGHVAGDGVLQAQTALPKFIAYSTLPVVR